MHTVVAENIYKTKEDKSPKLKRTNLQNKRGQMYKIKEDKSRKVKWTNLQN